VKFFCPLYEANFLSGGTRSNRGTGKRTLQNGQLH
jgi:hypothetical protein